MKITLNRFALTTLMFAMFTLLATGLANAKGGIPPQCANTITACGCTIGAPGNYQLGNDLFASQGLTLTNGCIDIEGLHINLTVNYNIFGPGSTESCSDGQGVGSPSRRKLQPQSPANKGVGIHVLPGAANVAISNLDAAICGWNYGVESEGNNVNLFELETVNNNVGVFLNNATDNSCLDCESLSNGTGFQISTGSGNTIGASAAAFNSQYGFWVDGSKHNMLSGSLAEENGLAGFYLGCSSTADVKSQIPCTIVTTTGNSLLDNGAFDNGKYGIAVERKSFYNNIEDNDSENNTKKDMIDGNANCVYNNYQLDVFATKSPNCIQ